jgi:preprotein translocase subunit YajC
MKTVEKNKPKQSLKEGDKVTIKGTVVAVDGDSVTIEITDDAGERGHRFTITGSQREAVSK